MKRWILLLAIAMLAGIPLSGCMKERLDQGNVLKSDRINQIHKGDSKFSVETTLGMPVLKSTLHPNRVTYVEDYEDKKTGKHITHGVEITYDDALRVIDIHRFGEWK